VTIRHIPAGMEPNSVARIDALLDRVVVEHGVFIPLAVESGSRAWGFPSPDSDYDCRFVFVRPVAQHLTPWPPRDVIEFPPEGDLDANGWELGKALRLLLKGNAVIVEWLCSPVVYRGEAWFRDEFLALARIWATRDAIAHHYLHLGERQRRVNFGDGTSVPLKKIFYALRPAAALRWLRARPGEAVAPMDFATLMAESAPPAEVWAAVAEIMDRKAVTRELGVAPLPPSIAQFIDTEFELARRAFPDGVPQPGAGIVRAAAEFYRTVVERLERERA
jgi:predicted nucleotidyltransferase